MLIVARFSLVPFSPLSVLTFVLDRFVDGFFTKERSLGYYLVLHFPFLHFDHSHLLRYGISPPSRITWWMLRSMTSMSSWRYGTVVAMKLTTGFGLPLTLTPMSF